MTKIYCFIKIYQAPVHCKPEVRWGSMNQKKIVLAGGTGFVGKYLKTKFTDLGYEVKIISRQSESIQWNDLNSISEALENSEMLINLAGKSVDCRYNKKNKEEILNAVHSFRSC